MAILLDKLKIFGVPPTVENGILAGLVLGDPVLLIGGPGSAKTDSVHMLGCALAEKNRKDLNYDSKVRKFNHRVYDMSSCQFEDIVGIPSPEAMKEGKLEFLQTPITIWGKNLVCLDEINRSLSEIQSKLLELVRDRTVQGIKTGVRYILACMNPFGDKGTNEMNGALVDRFMIYLNYKGFCDLEEDTRLQIINRVGHSDATVLKSNSKEKFSIEIGDTVNEHLAAVGEEITTLTSRATEIYSDLEKDVGTTLSLIIDKVLQSLNNHMIDQKDTERSDLTSGRRAGLIYRGALATRAIELAKSEIYNTRVGTMFHHLMDVIPKCIPFGISGRMDPSVVSSYVARVKEDISCFWDTLEAEEGTAKAVNIAYEILRGKSDFRRLYLLLKYQKSLNEMAATSGWNKLIASYDPTKEPILTSIVHRINCVNPGIIPQNVVVKIPDESSVSAELQEIVYTTDNEELGKTVKPMIVELLKKWQNKPIIYMYLRTRITKAKTFENSSEARISAMLVELEDAAVELDKVLREKEEKCLALT